MTRRREQAVETLRVTRHCLEILRRMRDTPAHIYYDDETCVLLVSPQRKISHRTLKSLRTMRLIRPRDKTEPEVHVITNRGRQLLDTDPRTRRKENHFVLGDQTVEGYEIGEYCRECLSTLGDRHFDGCSLA